MGASGESLGPDSLSAVDPKPEKYATGGSQRDQSSIGDDRPRL